jgi:hypothetical protein
MELISNERNKAEIADPAPKNTIKFDVSKSNYSAQTIFEYSRIN